MNRRNFVVAGALGAGTIASRSLASGSAHYKHVGMKASGLSDKKLKKAVETSQECLEKGEACLQHCILMLAGGDKKMATCMAAVQNMLASCQTMVRVASLNTASKKSILALAEACASICDECYEACKAHSKKHSVCRECMESCEKCAKACRDLA